MSEITIEVGKNIRELRQSSGISQEELSFQAQVNAAHLGQIERGLQNPTLETLEKIATALDVPLVGLFYPSEIVTDEVMKAIKIGPFTKPLSNKLLYKIHSQLLTMSTEELKDVLQLIRIYRRAPRSNN